MQGPGLVDWARQFGILLPKVTSMGRKEAAILPCPTSSPSTTETAASSEEMDSLEMVFM